MQGNEINCDAVIAMRSNAMSERINDKLLVYPYTIRSIFSSKWEAKNLRTRLIMKLGEHGFLIGCLRNLLIWGLR